ncbi:hypothetical protein AB0K21_07095 [Streptosporangium sp. NPDC049248]|uniref:hypothetical protein n=1 Tax=Streptosporangium sp. NPDC049248 TaxID=3155651 RepID=UPI003440155F
MSFDHRSIGATALMVAASLTTAAPSAARAHEAPTTTADRVLRVYNNNIENLVRNNADGSCTRVSGPDHLTSMLVDDNGKTGTSDVQAPDLLIVQQVRGTGQATAYADQLSAKFGYPAGTYKAIVAWDDPEVWGGTHKCSQQSHGHRPDNARRLRHDRLRNEGDLRLQKDRLPVRQGHRATVEHRPHGRQHEVEPSRAVRIREVLNG